MHPDGGGMSFGGLGYIEGLRTGEAASYVFLPIM
jgi:hypothetical protein